MASRWSFGKFRSQLGHLGVQHMPLLKLYRCHVIYAMNYWIIAFPCLMYLASVGMCRVFDKPATPLIDTSHTGTGINYIYQNSRSPTTLDEANLQINSGTAYLSISLSLNVILTLMIATRLILHSKNIRNAMGASAGPTNGLYTAIVTTLVESSAPYAIALILYIGPWAANSPATNMFTAVVGDIQVCVIPIF